MDENKIPWKKIGSKIVYENRWIKIHEDIIERNDDSKGIYGYMESKDSVKIIAVNNIDEIFLVRAFNYPLQIWVWTLPGGGGDNEKVIEASKRELAEETNISANNWLKLGKIIVCNGLMTERMSYYLASDITFAENSEKAEDVATGLIDGGKFFSLKQIRKMVTDGIIDDGQTITGLYLYERWLTDK